MLRSKRLAIGLCLVIGGAISVWLLRPWFRAPLPPLEISLWYWHQPFRLDSAEVAELKALGVRHLFVRAGTFRKEGDAARLILPQRWASRADGLGVHLVFNFDYSLVRSFGGMEKDTLAASI